MRLDPFRRPPWWKAYSFILITGVLFLGSWFGQLYWTAVEVAGEQQLHGARAGWQDLWPAFWSATFENWQSEFLQLCWQAAGLAMFYHWGSSQSREGNDRIEAKLDRLLAQTEPPKTTFQFRDTTLTPDQLRNLPDPPT